MEHEVYFLPDTLRIWMVCNISTKISRTNCIVFINKGPAFPFCWHYFPVTRVIPYGTVRQSVAEWGCVRPIEAGWGCVRGNVAQLGCLRRSAAGWGCVRLSAIMCGWVQLLVAAWGCLQPCTAECCRVRLLAETHWWRILLVAVWKATSAWRTCLFRVTELVACSLLLK